MLAAIFRRLSSSEKFSAARRGTAYGLRKTLTPDNRGLDMAVFRVQCELPCTAEEAFDWHERPGALDRLLPPWEDVRIVRRGDGIHDGCRVVIGNRVGPLRVRWEVEHADYEYGRQFKDIQQSGPFARWEHTHRFTPMPTGSQLEDYIEYEIPAGHYGQQFAGNFVREKLTRMFAFRHRTTVADLAAHSRYKEKGIMHIAISGSHGLVGTEAANLLSTGGHQVTRIVRGSATEGEISWDPRAEAFDATPLAGVDAVVHLAGESISSGRWNDEQKRKIRESRVQGTRILCEGLAKLENPPKTLVCASAIGFYGDRGEELLTETSPQGEGFLADVVRDWESATEPAKQAGIRVVNLRFGVVLSPKGGALGKMLTPFKLGAGGIVGSGRQFWSWIAIDDAAGAIQHTIMNEALHGPVNVVSPSPVTNAEFTKVLGRVLSRPTIIPMPAFAAKLALGQMADELLLASTCVQPGRLQETEYVFRHDGLEDALRHLLGK